MCPLSRSREQPSLQEASIRWYDPLESRRRAGEDLSLPEDLGDEDLSSNENPFASDAHSAQYSNADPAISLAHLQYGPQYQN